MSDFSQSTTAPGLPDPPVEAPAPPRPPQLRMRFTRFDSLPEGELPPGYAIRAYRPGDEPAWAAVLESTGSLGAWDLARVEALLGAERHAIPEGTFFATCEDVPVAATCMVAGPGGENPEVGWVGVRPEHQGRRLSYHTCLAVLRHMRTQGVTSTYLLTDDFRVPAIRTYLRLGFEPEMTDASHPDRWKALLGDHRVP